MPNDYRRLIQTMRILHVIADDATPCEEQCFLNTLLSFKTIGIDQKAIIKTESHLASTLKEAGISFSEQKFGGMFDLRTKTGIQKIIEDMAPPIVQAYTAASIRLCDKLPAKTALVGLFANNDPQLLASCHGVLLTGIPKKEETDNSADEKTFPVHPLIPYDENNALPLSRSDHNTPETAFLIGSIEDSLGETKIDVIFQALREIPKIHYWIAGKPNTKASIKDMALKKAVHDRVHFIPLNDIPSDIAFLKALDLLVIPEQNKNMDDVIFKSWLVGTAVLNGKISPQSSIDHEKTGWKANGTNVLDIRAALTLLQDNHGIRKALARNGKNLVNTPNRQETALRAYIESYKKILASL